MLKHNDIDEKKPSRVVILGAKGFVGNAVKEKLIKIDVSTLALGREEVDLLNEDSIDYLHATLNTADSLVFVSAEAPVKNNNMLMRNIKMASNICEAIKDLKIRHVLYVSSDAVYKDSIEPLSENSCAQPSSLHGVMHLAREKMIANTYSGPLAIIRPTLIYGVNDPHNGYGPNRFRRLAEKDEDVVLFGKGEEQRDHVLIDDVAELIVRMLLHKSSGVLNAATGTVKSFHEIAECVISQFNESKKIKYTERQGEMPHNGYRPFDPSSTYKAFPDFKYTDIGEGIALTHTIATGGKIV